MYKFNYDLSLNVTIICINSDLKAIFILKKSSKGKCETDMRFYPIYYFLYGVSY